jgi:lysophospholipase
LRSDIRISKELLCNSHLCSLSRYLLHFIAVISPDHHLIKYGFLYCRQVQFPKPKSSWLTLGLAAIISILGSSITEPLVKPPYAESYAPAYVQCPSGIQWIRPADGLSQAEANWVQGRKQVVSSALEDYLERLQIKDFDLSKYLSHMEDCNYEDIPVMGLAISGGGWASAHTGTGAMRALDSRLEAAVEQRTGGLLQCLTYMSGLSGGGFPTMSFAVNNFPTADEIVELWHTSIDRFAATNDTQYAATFQSIFEDIGAKLEAGFPVGTADLFGRAWSYEFTSGFKGGLDVTLSGVVNKRKFISHEMPFPIIQAIELTDADVKFFGLKIPFANDTIVSFPAMIRWG